MDSSFELYDNSSCTGSSNADRADKRSDGSSSTADADVEYGKRRNAVSGRGFYGERLRRNLGQRLVADSRDEDAGYGTY